MTHNVEVRSPVLQTHNPQRPREFRDVLSRFATGLTVVSAITEQGPAGFTCQSFSALSLEPPLITICPSNTSTTWPRIAPGERFCVNVLGATAQALSSQFATSGIDKFNEVQWNPAPSGSPVLAAAVAWFDCAVAQIHPGGDHQIVVAHVSAMGAVGSDDDPLIFHRGSYARLLNDVSP
ncbi:flavin reductase family protein [Gordonia sp. NPDC003424]